LRKEKGKQMKLVTQEQRDACKSVEERVALGSSRWEVGDKVTFDLDGNEYEGEITSINPPECRVKTSWGEFGSNLSMLGEVPPK
jgi:predicted lysophospholipase L1 biosynthesis ABC-type transport system permease subunit